MKRILTLVAGLALMIGTAFAQEIPGAVERLQGMWRGGLMTEITLEVKEVVPVTASLGESCEAAGYFQIQDPEVKRLADEVINSESPPGLEIFFAKIMIQNVQTIAKISYFPIRKMAVLEAKYSTSGPISFYLDNIGMASTIGRLGTQSTFKMEKAAKGRSAKQNYQDVKQGFQEQKEAREKAKWEKEERRRWFPTPSNED